MKNYFLKLKFGIIAIMFVSFFTSLFLFPAYASIIEKSPEVSLEHAPFRLRKEYFYTTEKEWEKSTEEEKLEFYNQWLDQKKIELKIKIKEAERITRLTRSKELIIRNPGDIRLIERHLLEE